ncbi:MAG: glutamine--fructose-6-phosphate transaminase (isomerizing), partial [Verrucomicrobiia bacterium]
MCGIVGYIGKREASPILLEGLKRLEYRGYDSAGVVVLADGTLKLKKHKGRVTDLARNLDAKSLSGSLGISHTRWAT